MKTVKISEANNVELVLAAQSLSLESKPKFRKICNPDYTPTEADRQFMLDHFASLGYTKIKIDPKCRPEDPFSMVGFEVGTLVK